MTDDAETPALYWYWTEPGDPDHCPASWFHSGVVRATPSEIATIQASIPPRHEVLLRVRPWDQNPPISAAALRLLVGQAIDIYHEDVRADKPCPEDAELIAAWKAEHFRVG